jgi:hypothetical protein
MHKSTLHRYCRDRTNVNSTALTHSATQDEQGGCTGSEWGVTGLPDRSAFLVLVIILTSLCTSPHVLQPPVPMTDLDLDPDDPTEASALLSNDDSNDNNNNKEHVPIAKAYTHGPNGHRSQQRRSFMRCTSTQPPALLVRVCVRLLSTPDVNFTTIATTPPVRLGISCSPFDHHLASVQFHIDTIRLLCCRPSS